MQRALWPNSSYTLFSLSIANTSIQRNNGISTEYLSPNAIILRYYSQKMTVF